MIHPIIKDLTWRYTTKKYDPSRKVSEENLQILFEAMRLSASSINSQPWRFIVIETEDARRRLHRTFSEQNSKNRDHVFTASQIILFAHNPRYTREDYTRVMDQNIRDGRVNPQDREAAFKSYRFADANTDTSGFNGCWTKAQTYLALGNTLHTLARLRIDSTPIEGIDVEPLNQEFKNELAGYRCEVALAIGYYHPEGDANSKLPKSRLDAAEVFFRV